MRLTNRLTRAFGVAVLVVTTITAARARNEIVGRWSDDYGNSFRVTHSLFEQLPSARYHIVEWNHVERYFVARNDDANRADAGKWTRVDWMPFSGMEPYTWGFCFTAYRAETQEEARATRSAKREAPRTGCNGFPFSRMKPAP